MNKETVKDALRSSGDEYHYRTDACDIGGDLIRPQHLEVKHFVVRRDERGNNIGSLLLESLFEVMREDRITQLTIEMGATECNDCEELEKYRQTTGEDDPTVSFLQKHGFQNITPVETFQWGLVFRASRSV